MAKEHRLLARPQFQLVFDRGRKFFSRNFVVFALPRESGTWRLGLTVTRKTGSAPKRNRVKRVIREFFRLHQHEFDAPVDVVVVPKRKLDPTAVGLDMVTEELLPIMRRVSRQAVADGDGA